MQNRRRAATVLLLAPLAVFFARADLSDVVLSVRAWNDAGAARFEAYITQGVWDATTQTYTLSLSEPIDLIDSDTEEWVACILGVDLTVGLNDNFEIALNVGLCSGTTETFFMIDSPLVRFRTVPGADSRGRAAGSFTVTDVDGNFAMLRGLGPPGTGACITSYNGAYPNGTEFCELVSFVYAGAMSTTTGTQRHPPFGYLVIGEDVQDVSVYLAFSVTPLDVAFAATQMAVPEPLNRCNGDINLDYRVDLADLAILLASYGFGAGDAEFNIDADFDEDGFVAVGDLTLLLAAFGVECP